MFRRVLQKELGDKKRKCVSPWSASTVNAALRTAVPSLGRNLGEMLAGWMCCLPMGTFWAGSVVTSIRQGIVIIIIETLCFSFKWTYARLTTMMCMWDQNRTDNLWSNTTMARMFISLFHPISLCCFQHDKDRVQVVFPICSL